MSQGHDLPPVPGSGGSVSRTELIPFRSKKISIARSAILAPGLATVLLCVWLFTARAPTAEGTIYYTIYGIGAYIIFITFWLIHSYSGSSKPLWVYALVATFTALFITDQEPAWRLLATLFRKVLPGDVVAVRADAAFANRFVAHLFGAGLLEELVKSIPVFICAGIGVLLARSRQPNRIFDRLAVRTPLDGLLIGLASGVGFIVNETLFEYVPNIVNVVQRQTNDQAAALLSGLRLVIPRTLQSFGGHMGWAGIFGYFIGLACVRRKSWLQLLIIGYLIASVTHGLWNSVGIVSVYLQYAVVIVGFGMFLACLLKARQLEPLLSGQPARATHSILVVPPASAPAPLPSNQYAYPASPAAVARPDPSSFALTVEGTRIQLAHGARVDLGFYPAFGGRGAGTIVEVTAHPSDPSLIGLRNLGNQTWTATGADGSTHSVPPRRVLRIEAGTRIDFGTISGDIRGSA